MTIKEFGRVLIATIAVVAIAVPSGIGIGAMSRTHSKEITETHDDDRGITCYTYGDDGISCIPDQWLKRAAADAEAE